MRIDQEEKEDDDVDRTAPRRNRANLAAKKQSHSTAVAVTNSNQLPPRSFFFL